MDTATLLNSLRKERDELSATIAVLERRMPTSTAGKTKPHGRRLSAKARAAMSRKLKQVWAQKRKARAARSKAAKAARKG